MNIEEVVAKIKKLFALSTSSNQHEAALAAARASALMAEYQIEEAALQSTSEADEPVDSHSFEASRKKVHWRMAVAAGCARVCNCKPYWHGPEIKLIGRQSDVRAAYYLFGLITPQVDALAEKIWHAEAQHEAWEGKRRWMHAFRLGCARTIQNRLENQHRERVEALRKQASAGQRLLSGASSSTALMVVDGRLAKVQNFAERLGLGRGRSATSSSSSGYSYGKQAGQRVNLGGQARGAIGSPLRQIR